MAAGQTENQHFLDYWRMIQSRKEIVIAVFLFLVVAGVVITLSLPRVYLASTRIAVRQDMSDVAAFQFKQQQNLMMAGYDPYFLRTQFEVIQSRPILYQVIRNLRLQEHFGRIYSDDGGALTLPETYRLLAGSMKVQQYRDTNLIEIRIYRGTRRSDKDTARRDAARIANEIASVYRDQRMRLNREETERGYGALKEAYTQQQKNVQQAEDALEGIRKQLNVNIVAQLGAGSVASLDSARLERLEANRIMARKTMLERKTRLEELDRLQGDELLYSAAYMTADPALAALRQQLTEAETILKRFQESLGSKHPDVVRSQAVVDDLKRKVGETLKGLKKALQTDYEIARRDLEASDADLAAARATDISSQSERYLPFTKAESEVTRLRQIRDALEMRVVQERIELDLPKTPVEVVEPAEVPEEDDFVSPKMVLNIVLSMLVGLGCGMGLVFFIEYLDTSVKTVEDIEQYIGAQIVGIIPQKVRPLADDQSDSGHAEAYRVLRMNIDFSKKLAGGNTLCLTSGGAGEGKSLSLFNLAFVCSQLGKKVLVVDSDLRRPTQHKMFKISNREGLADVLLGKAGVLEMIKPSSMPNMDFMPSGKLPSSAHGMFTAQRLREIIGVVRSRYDYVFFDSPPILGVSDASILSSEVDGVLLVVQHRSYPRAVSSRAKMMIENVGGNLIGVVLNNLNVTRDYYYYYHSYYYSYRDKGKGHEELPTKGAAAAPAKPAAEVGSKA